MRSTLPRPQALALLLTVIGLERFAHYAVRGAIKPLIAARLLLDPEGASIVRGYVTAGVFGAYIVGGVVADRVMGHRRAVLAGAVLAALGAIGTVTPLPLGIALGAWVLGGGLMVPSAYALVGEIHERGHPGRDAAFAWALLAVNLGSFAGGMASGTGAAPIVAAFGYAMVAGVFVIAQRRMPAARAEIAPEAKGIGGRTAALALMAGCVLIAAIAQNAPQVPSTEDGAQASDILLGLAAIGGLLGAMPVALTYQLLERSARRRTGVLTVGIGLAMQGVGSLLAASATLVLLLAGLLLSGAGTLVTMSAGPSLVSRLAPARFMALAMGGWLTLPFLGGVLIGPLVSTPLPASVPALVIVGVGLVLIAAAPRFRATEEDAEAPPRGPAEQQRPGTA